MCKSGEGYFCPFKLSIIFKTFSFKVKTVFPQRKFFNTFVRPSVVWGNVVVFFFLEIFSMRPWHPPVSLCVLITFLRHWFGCSGLPLWYVQISSAIIYELCFAKMAGPPSSCLCMASIVQQFFLSLMIIIINPPNLVSASRLWKMSRGM